MRQLRCREDTHVVQRINLIQVTRFFNIFACFGNFNNNLQRLSSSLICPDLEQIKSSDLQEIRSIHRAPDDYIPNLGATRMRLLHKQPVVYHKENRDSSEKYIYCAVAVVLEALLEAKSRNSYVSLKFPKSTSYDRVIE